MGGAGMSRVLTAWIEGAKRVGRAPALLAAVWIATTVLALPLAAVLRDMIAQQLGHSMTAESVAAGVNYDWMQEFADQASGIGVTFKPTIIGFGAVLDNLSAFLDNVPRPPVIVAAATAYVFVWIFLAGGIIDRLARDRAVGGAGFFAECGVYFVRFLRLAAVQWIVYAILFGIVHAYLFGTLFPELTRDMTVERTAFLVRVALYFVFGALVGIFNVLFDYAKVRAVVEDRRSMLGALSGAGRFLIRDGAAVGVYLVNVALFAVIVTAYGLIAPGVGGSAVTMWIAFAIGQLFVLARLGLKLLFWASETALFQSQLAHAGYVASPVRRWPDSPAAEAISD